MLDVGNKTTLEYTREGIEIENFRIEKSELKGK